MKKIACLLALLTLAFMPAQAGVSVSVHFGGGYCGAGFHGGGYCGGYHCFYGGRGCASYGGYYGYAPYYGSGYGYASYPVGYDSGSYYGGSVEPTVYTAYAPTDTTSAQPTVQAANPASTPTGPLPAGKVDEFGFVHSPYSTTTFKAGGVANGQVFYDPTTGQPFIVHVTAPATAPAAVVPSASATPTGKLDEFGYVHSPFSTFTFKVQSGNYAQLFRDPFTGQSFTVRPAKAPEAVASTKLSD